MVKLICNQDSFTKTKGLFNKITYKEKINGLTEGKIYVGYPVTSVSGDGNLGFGTIESRVDFLIFNDHEEWKTYQCDLFSPLSLK